MADIDRLLARGVISERAAQRMMTHFPDQPNPAQPVLDAVGRFARGGISGVIGHHDPLGDALQSEGANAALGVMTPLKSGALQRNVLARDPATRRPMRTERLPDSDERILEKIGENNLRGPTDPEWKRMAATVRRESFEGDSYDLEFKAVRDAVAQGMPFRHAMLKHGSPSLLEAFEHVTKKDRGALGLGWPEELPFERPDEAVPESYYRSGPGVVNPDDLRPSKMQK